MCGRVVWVWDPATGELVARYDDQALEDPELARLLQLQRYNVPPTSTLPFILAAEGGTHVKAARWGFPVPGAPGGAFNTRVEAARSSPLWRTLLGSHHALLPVKGFYEWRRAGSTRTPFFVHRADGAPMLLASLWGLREVDGEARTCASVVTCPANAAVAAVHDRMPVVLEAAEADAWLHPGDHGVEELLALADPAPEDILAMHPVSTAVNRTENDSPDLMKPTGQQALF